MPNVEAKSPLRQLKTMSSPPVTDFLAGESGPCLATTFFKSVWRDGQVCPEPPVLGHVLQPHPAQTPETDLGLSYITRTHFQHVGGSEHGQDQCVPGAAQPTPLPSLQPQVCQHCLLPARAPSCPLASHGQAQHVKPGTDGGR